jgi:hypothetical protein
MKKNINNVLGAIIIVGLVVALGKYFLVPTSDVPASRLWMEYVMDIVRETKPAPTESAYLYAAVSTLYNENMQMCQDSSCGNSAVAMFFDKMYPKKNASTSEFINKNNLKYFEDEIKNQKISESIDKSVEGMVKRISDNKKIPETWRLLGTGEPIKMLWPG